MSRAKKLFVWVGPVLLLAVTAAAALAGLGNNLLNVSLSTTDAGYPAIAVSADGNNIGIVWAERYDGGGAAQGPIYFKGATDGANLGPNKVVDFANSTTDQSWSPDIAVDPTTGSNMHIVWKNLSGSSPQVHTIYYTLCPVVGDCSSGHEQVAQVSSSGDSAEVLHPRLAVSAGGGVQVVWHQTNTDGTQKAVYYRGKGSGGWDGSATAVSDTAGEYAWRPAVAVSRSGATDYVHVVWAADTNKDGTNDVIRYRRGTIGAGGTVSSWAATQSMATVAGTEDPDFPAVAAIEDTVVVLWDVKETDADSEDDYYGLYAYSTDNGGSFSGAIDISQDTAGSYVARVSDSNGAGSGNDLDPPAGEGSVHGKRLQIQATFQPGSGAVTGYLHIVWHQTNPSGGTGGVYKHDVFHNSRPFPDSQCGIDCWGTPNNNNKLGSNPSALFYSMSPDVAVDSSGQVYAVYMESKDDGEFEVTTANGSNTLKVIDIIYNGTKALVDSSRKVYLPAIVKNAS